jgi:hypothetical protein
MKGKRPFTRDKVDEYEKELSNKQEELCRLNSLLPSLVGINATACRQLIKITEEWIAWYQDRLADNQKITKWHSAISRVKSMVA